MKKYLLEEIILDHNNDLIEFGHDHCIESCDSWSDVEAYEYIDHLEDLGLDYHKYDDPDMMWTDYLKAVEALGVNIEEA